MHRPNWLSGNLVAGLWALTIVFGYLGPGGYAQEAVEGIATEQIPLWPSIVFALLLLGSLVTTVWWARTLSSKQQPGAAADTDLPASGRRKFLTGSAAVTGGVIGVAGAAAARVSGWATVTGPALSLQTEQTAPVNKEAWRGAVIREYRALGNTGLKVSDIAAGSTRLHQNPDPVGFLNAMLDRGVNYIDASPDYAPESEAIIKQAIAGRDRSKLIISTKFCTASGHLREGSSFQEYKQAMESALTSLGTDYNDEAHIHSCDSIGRLMDESDHEAVDRLREQCKVRYLGVSTQTPNL